MLKELLQQLKILTRQTEPPVHLTIRDANGATFTAPKYRWVLESIEVARDYGTATTSEDITIDLDRDGKGDVRLVRENVSAMPDSIIREFGGRMYTYEPGEDLIVACANTETCHYTVIIKYARA